MVEQREATMDLSAILDSSHENKWVAIAPDYSKVIAAADTLRDLMRSVSTKDAIYHRVLPRDVNFAPAA
jgi:predicted RNase H-like HicB family nuclease